MSYIGWRFPPNLGGHCQGYTNNDIELFTGEQLIDNLAREICQNSLDAFWDRNEPVKVVFELKRIEKNKYKAFTDYKKCLSGCRKLWGTDTDEKLNVFLDEAERVLAQDMIPVLIASDKNTKGLKGSRTRNKKDPWEALTGEDGISVDKGETGSGAFGIGKNAPFACSSLSMVFYNTYSREDNEKAFVGVSRLASLLDDDGRETQRIGKYQNNDNENEKWDPIYYNNSDDFRDLFKRDDYGTDVIVAGFNHEENWADEVKKAVINNFFVAILENRLEVEIIDSSEQCIINSERIGKILDDYKDTLDVSVIRTIQLYNAYNNPDTHEYFSIIDENDAEIFIKTDNNYKRCIASFRDSGMLVGMTYKKLFQHYAAILIIRGTKLSTLLRDCEPPRHNRWDYKLIKGNSPERKKTRKDAKNAIELLDEKLSLLIKSQYETTSVMSIDAEGVSQYLPDMFGNDRTDGQGDDLLLPKVKIGKIKKDKAKPANMETRGKKGEGNILPGDVHNETHFPHPDPPYPIPKPVIPEDEDNNKQGIVPNPGSKTIRIPNINAQRAYPIKADIGLYKIIVFPNENYNDLFVSCSAVGEDGKTDGLTIEKFKYNNKTIKTNGNIAGPISVIANEAAEFFVTFKNTEKMMLNISVYREN